MSLLYSYNLLCVYSFDFPEVNNSHICWQLSDTEICCTQSISFGAQHRSFQMSLTKSWHDFFCSSQNMSNFFLCPICLLIIIMHLSLPSYLHWHLCPFQLLIVWISMSLSAVCRLVNIILCVKGSSYNTINKPRLQLLPVRYENGLC